MENIRYMLWVVPIFFVAMGIEAFFLRRNFYTKYPWKESLASLGVWIGQQVSNILFGGMILGLMELVYRHRIYTVTPKTLSDYLLILLAVDFVYYWHHRLHHEIRWGWATHSVHHSPTHLNLSASYRLGWTNILSGGFVLWLPLNFLGISPSVLALMLTFNLIYQFWLHTELIPKLGWFEFFFNSPSHHRVHHAINPQYLDKNYGGILIIFDRLFGTFQVEGEPCRYGVLGEIPSLNPFRIAFSGWLKLYHQVASTKGLKSKLKIAFGPTVLKRPASPEISTVVQVRLNRKLGR